jgi:hypothetical protein
VDNRAVSRPERAAGSKYRVVSRRARLAVAAVWLTLSVVPAVASAHGPVAPVATSYLARIGSVPAGLQAKVVDGYVRMWLRVPPRETVTVLDYRGAPYLRFSPAGVYVNQNSEMYYLNQTPVAETPPSGLTARTPPSWHLASGGHAYEWHDGRLQALASVALAPGAIYIGRWSIPLLVNGRRASIAGGLWHADNPSIVWFWPIVVLLAAVLAAWRVRSVELDARTARVLGLACLLAIAVADVGRELHGRPGVTVGQYVELAIVAAFVAWAARAVLFGGAGDFVYFVIGIVALWEGLNLVPTLVHPFVLLALPSFLARTATVLCLGCGASIMFPIFRLAERRMDRESVAGDELDEELALHDG